MRLKRAGTMSSLPLDSSDPSIDISRCTCLIALWPLPIKRLIREGICRNFFRTITFCPPGVKWPRRFKISLYYFLFWHIRKAKWGFPGIPKADRKMHDNRITSPAWTLGCGGIVCLRIQLVLTLLRTGTTGYTSQEKFPDARLEASNRDRIDRADGSSMSTV